MKLITTLLNLTFMLVGVALISIYVTAIYVPDFLDVSGTVLNSDTFALMGSILLVGGTIGMSVSGRR